MSCRPSVCRGTSPRGPADGNLRWQRESSFRPLRSQHRGPLLSGSALGLVDTFTASIAVTLLTTLAAPLLLRFTLPKQPPTAEEFDPDPAESAHRLELASQIEQLEG